MAELDQEVIENLKRSRELIGELEEVLITPDGEVIDGKHRLKAYPGWKTRTVQADRKTLILTRLHKNFRRNVPRAEVKELLNELAIILKQEGIPEDQIAQEIVKLSPYSENYTLSLLPKKYKQPKAVKAAQATYKILYKEERKKAKQKTKQEEKFLTCPACGTRLVLKGELLYIAKS